MVKVVHCKKENMSISEDEILSRLEKMEQELNELKQTVSILEGRIYQWTNSVVKRLDAIAPPKPVTEIS